MPIKDDSPNSDWNWDETAISLRKIRVEKRIQRAHELCKELKGTEKKIFDSLWPFIERQNSVDPAAIAEELGISISEVNDVAANLFARLLRN